MDYASDVWGKQAKIQNYDSASLFSIFSVKKAALKKIGFTTHPEYIPTRPG